MLNILLIDDEIEKTEPFVTYLENERFVTTRVLSGNEGISMALSGNFDLTVLDVNIPEISGIEVLSRIRAHSTVPIIILSNHGDDIDRIVGFEMGADDYVPKSCTPRELLARIRAVLRRKFINNTDDIESLSIIAGPIEVHPKSRIVEYKNHTLQLTSIEFNLIEILARNVGHIVSKEELSETALGRPFMRFDRSIDVHISSLRQKLGNRDDSRSWIQTVRGKGYQLCP